MPAFHVQKSIEINSAPEVVYDYLSDFNNWRFWSPWLILEPEAKVTVAPGGKHYAWEGNRTGSGEMKVMKENPAQRLDLQVTFLKPWKSTSATWFEFTPNATGTVVTWCMDSSLPFFLFFMKKMMTAYLGMDYSRGLAMLKDQLETGSVPSKLSFKGITSYGGCTYVGYRTTCTMSTVGERMKQDFGKLFSWAKDKGDLLNGIPFSIYHKWDIINDKVEYTAAFPVKSAPPIPEGAVTGSIPAVKVNSIVHTGSYKHLGNAWSAQYNMQRAKVYKWKKGIDPFEVYLTMPGTTPESEQQTDVQFPVVER
ncbi:MAG: SRPBCC family protein [Cytophagales bacterium]|nr:SRPBCC family protein [Cytophagales bacterium]